MIFMWSVYRLQPPGQEPELHHVTPASCPRRHVPNTATRMDSRLRGRAPPPWHQHAEHPRIPKRPSHWEKVLGRKHPWARGKHPSYWTNILGGNDGFPTGQSMKVTMYGWFKRRVAEVAAKVESPAGKGWTSDKPTGQHKEGTDRFPLFSSLLVARLESRATSFSGRDHVTFERRVPVVGPQIRYNIRGVRASASPERGS